MSNTITVTAWRHASVLVAVSFVVLVGPRSAHAGPSDYGWLYGTEVVPRNSVEIESAVDERNVQFASVGDHETTWWVAPVVGIAEGLELVLPVESKWYSEDNPTPGFVSQAFVPRRYGAELRYRLFAQDPASPSGFVSLLRVAIKRDVAGALRPEADIVVSFEKGRVNALVDAGITADYSTTATFSRLYGDHHVQAYPGFGVSIRTIDELRFGAEAHVEWSLDENESGHTWGIAGPDIAWRRGRFWVSAVYGVGVYGIRSAPRVVWGVAM